MNKKYVIDTSVLLYDLDALFKFGDEDEVIIPSIVCEELNKIKEESSERGYAARKIMIILEELSKIRPLIEGVRLDEAIDICPNTKKQENIRTLIRRDYNIWNDQIKKMLIMDENDYNIISCALNNNALLISRDRGMRSIGSDFVKVSDYNADKVDTKEIYKGYKKVEVESELIDELYLKKAIPDVFNLYSNEFIVMSDRNNRNHVGVGIKKVDKIKLCDFTQTAIKKMTLNPLNLEQKMFLYLLFDDDIKCVTATGLSGKGKSLLSVDYALSSVQSGSYNKFLYTKSTINVDKREDLGFYKGGVEEKLKPHLQPLYSSIELLYKNNIYKGKERKTVDDQIQELVNSEILAFYPLANIRGMSIFDKIVMLDEAQNVTNHMIKSLVTRVTDTSKLIVVGDIEQIDDRNLNKFNNGLVHLIEAGKDEEFIGHLCMDIDTKSRRGKLSEFGSKKL